MTWRSVPEVGSTLGIRLVVGTLRLFGRRVTSALLWLVCWYSFAFSANARRSSKTFFAHLGRTPTARDVHRHWWTFRRGLRALPPFGARTRGHRQVGLSHTLLTCVPAT